MSLENPPLRKPSKIYLGRATPPNFKGKLSSFTEKPTATSTLRKLETERWKRLERQKGKNINRHEAREAFRFDPHSGYDHFRASAIFEEERLLVSEILRNGYLTAQPDSAPCPRERLWADIDSKGEI